MQMEGLLFKLTICYLNWRFVVRIVGLLFELKVFNLNWRSVFRIVCLLTELKVSYSSLRALIPSNVFLGTFRRFTQPKQWRKVQQGDGKRQHRKPISLLPFHKHKDAFVRAEKQMLHWFRKSGDRIIKERVCHFPTKLNIIKLHFAVTTDWPWFLFYSVAINQTGGLSVCNILTFRRVINE